MRSLSSLFVFCMLTIGNVSGQLHISLSFEVTKNFFVYMADIADSNDSKALVKCQRWIGNHLHG